MSDNVLKDGIPVATDNIGGQNYQRIKMTWGPDGTAHDVSDGNPFPIIFPGRYQSGPLTDASGTVTFGDTFQALFGDGTEARHRSVQNPVDATETLFVKIGTTVYEISPGNLFERNASDFMPTDDWQIKAITAGHAFIAAEA